MSESMDESGVQFVSKNLSAVVATPTTTATNNHVSCFNFNSQINTRLSSTTSSLLSTTSSSSSASSSSTTTTTTTATPFSFNDENFESFLSIGSGGGSGGGGGGGDMINNMDTHKNNLIENKKLTVASKHQSDS